MNSVLEVLFLRRPSIDYISCPVCEFDFSSSGGPVIILDALGRLFAPSGFVLGGRGRFTLSWNSYPGALCYTVYKAVDSNNPFGEYVVVAECIEDPSINLEPEGPGCYRVSAITPNGETELSDPICEVGNCPFIISGATPSSQTVDEGDPFMISTVISNPGAVQSFIWYKDGVPFEDTTATTEEELSVPSATQLNEGNYTLVIEGNGCSDESLPASVTVTDGPPCTHHIEVVGFLGAVGIASNGSLVGTNDAGLRPFYHRNGVSRDVRDSVDSSPITASQAATTVTASADFFSPSDVGRFLTFATSETAEITAYISPTQVTVTPSQSVPSTTFVVNGATLGGATGQGLEISTGYIGGLEEPFSDPGVFHAFWFNINTSEIRDLGAFPRAPVAVNETGFTLLNDGPTALLYDPVLQTFTDLGDLGGFATAVALSNTNVVALDCAVGADIHACRWAAGVLTDIHPAAAGSNDSSAFGVNSAGNVFGDYEEDVTFLEKTFINTGGASVSIGAGLGGFVNGVAMNDSAQIVGTLEVGAGTGITRPFIWDSVNGIQTLPQLPATTQGFAVGINADGWVIGTMDGIPFLYRNGVTEELFTLVPGGTLWTQFFTVDLISDNGWISGIGLHDGNVARYLMQLCS